MYPADIFFWGYKNIYPFSLGHLKSSFCKSQVKISHKLALIPFLWKPQSFLLWNAKPKIHRPWIGCSSLPWKQVAEAQAVQKYYDCLGARRECVSRGARWAVRQVLNGKVVWVSPRSHHSWMPLIKVFSVLSSSQGQELGSVFCLMCRLLQAPEERGFMPALTMWSPGPLPSYTPGKTKGRVSASSWWLFFFLLFLFHKAHTKVPRNGLWPPE